MPSQPGPSGVQLTDGVSEVVALGARPADGGATRCAFGAGRTCGLRDAVPLRALAVACLFDADDAVDPVVIGPLSSEQPPAQPVAAGPTNVGENCPRLDVVTALGWAATALPGPAAAPPSTTGSDSNDSNATRLRRTHQSRPRISPSLAGHYVTPTQSLLRNLVPSSGGVNTPRDEPRARSRPAPSVWSPGSTRLLLFSCPLGPRHRRRRSDHGAPTRRVIALPRFRSRVILLTRPASESWERGDRLWLLLAAGGGEGVVAMAHRPSGVVALIERTPRCHRLITVFRRRGPCAGAF